MKINKTAARASDLLEKITAVPLIIVGGLMVTIVLLGTFYRYVLNDPLLWTEEAARYLMIWMALAAASIALKRNEHVGIEFFIKRLKPLPQKIVTLLTRLLIGYFLYILVIEGIKMTINAQTQVSPALGISMFWPLLAVPVAGVLTLIQLALQIIIVITEGVE